MTSADNLKRHLRFHDRLDIVSGVAVALATNGANIAAMEVERHHEWADIFFEVGATVSGYTTIKACCQLLQKRESKTQKRWSRLRS